MATAPVLPQLEAHTPQTSLDPYGQLVKMLMPRALGIAIYDRKGVPLWLSDGCESPDLLQLIEEALATARKKSSPTESEGFLRSWDGEPAYVFILRDDAHRLLGALAVSCRDPGTNSPRPVSLVQGLLRPALAVLSRELSSQYSIGDLQRNLITRDGDLELLIDASGGGEEGDSDEFAHLVQNCVAHLGCTFGALIIPDKNISIARTAQGVPTAADNELIERTQRHLLAWSQVQRRTVTLNRAPPSSPLAALPYKLLVCPLLQGPQLVMGILVLLKPTHSADFELRHVRIVELLGRRIAYVLQNAYDPATGLLTRPAFEKRALATLAGAANQHCVVYGDIDKLHTLNENYGMHIGDEVIARVGKAIRNSLGSRMSAARISGGRFGLLFPDCSIDTAIRFAESLSHCVSAMDVKVAGEKLDLSLSLGVATVADIKLPLSHALALAEQACKAAKDRGRGCVERFKETDRNAPVRRDDSGLIDAIRHALAHDSFRLDAQPVVALGKTGGQRFELLLRMLDANGESVAPDKFVAAAERHQLATVIDRWVVQFALEVISSAAAALRATGVKFAINLSSQSLADDAFPQYLEDKLGEYGVPAGLLSFEITETAAVADIARAEVLIRRIQDLGHDMVLDDFGRGLSSLTHLKSLPVSELKIDGALVRDVVGNPSSQNMVSAIVEIAQTMKLRTTAKCVESEAIRDAMTQLGVQFGQGFLIGRPKPLEAVLQELLRSHSVKGIGPGGSSRIG